MKRDTKKPKAATTALLIALLAVAAPTFAESTKEIARGLRVNQQALLDFSWKSRAETTVNGKQKSVELFDVRYDMDGHLLKTPATTDTAAGKRKASRRNAGLTPDMKTLVDAYTHLTPVTLKAMFGKATVSPGVGDDSGLMRIQAEGVRALGDRVAIWVDRESKRPRRYEIEATLDGQPVRIETRFATLEDGPSYPARTTVRTQIKAKPLVFSIENFQFALQGG
jgi:outer membrane lipoprotein-sorting protein